MHHPPFPHLFLNSLYLTLSLTCPTLTLALDKPTVMEGPLLSLLKTLATVRTTTAQFTEEKRFAILDQPLIVKGTLHYEAPDYLNKQVTVPRPETYAIRGNQVTVTTMEGQRQFNLRDYPLLQTFVESLRATFTGDVETLNQYYQMQFSQTTNEWQIRLVPRQETLREYVNYLLLAGQEQHITRLETHEINGDTSIMTMVPQDE